MTAQTKTGLVLLTEDNLDEVGKYIEENFERDVIHRVQKALTFLQTFSMKNALLPESPAVTIRVETFKEILRTLQDSVQTDQQSAILRNLGRNIGEDFALNFLRFLRSHFIILETEVLLLAWNHFDSGAGWGTFRLKQLNKESILIALEDNFLKRGEPQDSHTYCDFITGYIDGVLWRLLKYHARWVAGSQRRHLNIVLEPKAVAELVEDICCFKIILKEEELSEAFDHEYEFLTNPPKKLREYALLLRSTLDSALKSKLDVPKKEKLYPRHLLKGLDQNQRATKQGIEVKRLEKLLSKLDRVVHGSEEGNINDFLITSKIISRNLRLIELMEPYGKNARERALAIARNAQKKKDSLSPNITVITNVDGNGPVSVIVDSNNVNVEQNQSVNTAEAIRDIITGVAGLVREINDMDDFQGKDRSVEICREILDRHDPGVPWLKEKLDTLWTTVEKVTPVAETVAKLTALLGVN